MPSDRILQRLRALIGRPVNHLGQRWWVIDLLAEETTLVLEDDGPRDGQPIQGNQFGGPQRRVPRTCLVPACDPRGRLRPEVASWLGGPAD